MEPFLRGTFKVQEKYLVVMVNQFMMDFSVKENSMVQGNGLDHMDNLTKVTFFYIKGDFVNGKKEGFGKYIFKSGRQYEGNFKDDKPEGEG